MVCRSIRPKSGNHEKRIRHSGCNPSLDRETLFKCWCSHYRLFCHIISKIFQFGVGLSCTFTKRTRSTLGRGYARRNQRRRSGPPNSTSIVCRERFRESVPSAVSSTAYRQPIAPVVGEKRRARRGVRRTIGRKRSSSVVHERR